MSELRKALSEAENERTEFRKEFKKFHVAMTEQVYGAVRNVQKNLRQPDWDLQ